MTQTRDPRGLIVVISSEMIRHAAGHWDDDEEETLARVVQACSDPTFIVQNHGNQVNPRTGNELYCRAETGSTQHVLVPARTGVVVVDGTNVEARIALSCYTGEAPMRRRIWLKT